MVPERERKFHNHGNDLGGDINLPNISTQLLDHGMDLVEIT